MDYKQVEIARNFLDGQIDKMKAIKLLQEYCLVPKARAERSLRFYNNYRSYIITYYSGIDMIRDYIERNGGTIDNPNKRWELFEELLSTPQTPSGLMRK